MIHPQAIVHPDARLGSGVEVGPFSVVGPEVEIGDRTWIGPHVVITGVTRIGADNRIFQFVSIGDAPQHLAYKGESTRLEIGDRNTIREFGTINRGTVAGGGLTRIGSDNFMMAYCHVAHDCVLGDHIVFANGSSLAGHVDVGDYAVFGGFTLVHQFCRVGAHCMTAAGVILFKDVPPFVTVGGDAAPHGLNTRGLKRRGFTEDTILEIKRAYKTLYRSGFTLEAAVAEIERAAGDVAEVGQFAAFVKATERGIIR